MFRVRRVDGAVQGGAACSARLRLKNVLAGESSQNLLESSRTFENDLEPLSFFSFFVFIFTTKSERRRSHEELQTTLLDEEDGERS